MIEVVNIVASTRFTDDLDLNDLADHIGITFEPEQFPGMIWKMAKHKVDPGDPPMPKATVLTFASGRSVVVGARTVDDIERAFNIVRKHLEDGGFDLWEEPHEVNIKNLVVVDNLGKELDLRTLSVMLPFTQTEYEPEQFPGLIYRQDVNGNVAVCLIFSSGKCVITGCGSFDDAELAAKQLAETIGELV